MKAVIIGGGYGTRLHPVTLRTPKFLMPIAGKPNITWIIDSLKKAGIEKAYLSINVNQSKVNDFLSKDKFIKVVLEDSSSDSNKLGSIGALKHLHELLGTDDYLVIGADNFYTGLSIKDFLKFHDANKGIATLALYDLPSKLMVEHYGIAVLRNNQVIDFQEKPRAGEARSKLASTLIYKISSEFFKELFSEYIDNIQNLDTIGSLWAYFCKKEKINGYVFKGAWGDIGKPKSYIETNKEAMTELKINSVHESVKIGPGTIIKPPVIIENGCVIGSNSVIGEGTHLMHDTQVGDNTIITGSVVFEDVRVGDNSRVTNSIIDGYAWINDNVVIDDYSIIGFKSVIKDKSKLFKNSRVWPWLSANGLIDGDVTPLDFDYSKLMESKYWL